MAAFFERLTEGLFFQTDKRPYWDITHFGLKGEHVRITGPNHSEIAGLFMPAFFLPDAPEPHAKGTILFAHSCEHNMQYHLPQITWLVAAGFNVFTYDPRGCGQTEGSIDLQTVVEDIGFAWDYLKTREEVNEQEIIVFGQRVGAYAALQWASHRNDVASLVLESIWATQSGWLTSRYGPGIGHLLASLCPMRPDPIEAMKHLSIPIALVVGEDDDRIPESEQKRLMNALPNQCEIWMEKGTRALGIFPQPSTARNRFLAFTKNVLSK